MFVNSDNLNLSGTWFFSVTGTIVQTVTMLWCGHFILKSTSNKGNCISMNNFHFISCKYCQRWDFHQPDSPMLYHLCSHRATNNKNLEKNNKIILKIKFWKSHLHTPYNVYIFFYKLRIKSTSFSSPQFLLCYHTMKNFFLLLLWMLTFTVL